MRCRLDARVLRFRVPGIAIMKPLSSSNSRRMPMLITRRSLLSLLAFPAAPLGGQQPQGMASRGVKPAPRAKPSGLPFHARLTDVGRQAGLKEIVVCGHADRCDYITETMSCGAAFLDYDNDGWLDIFVLTGSRFQDPPPAASN